MAADAVFIPVETTTSASALAETAKATLASKWDDWVPNAGDMEVIQIETIAPMAADTAETAARVFGSIWRNFGTKLKNLPYQVGLPATGTVTFTLADDEGHVIPIYTEISIDGVSFTTQETVTVPPDQDIAAGVPITASLSGAVGNDLEGAVVEVLSALRFVESVSLDAPTANGADPELDPAYQDRLRRRMRLSAETLVVARDYELLTLDDPRVARVTVSADTDTKTIVVTGMDYEGTGLDSSVKADLLVLYNDYRLSNWTVSMSDPTFTTMAVTYQVVAYDGYDHDDLIARVDAALTAYLDPLVWGSNKIQADDSLRSGVWVNQATVYKNDVIGIIDRVEGVRRVVTATLTGSAGAASGGDWNLPGTVPVAVAGTMTGTVA